MEENYIVVFVEVSFIYQVYQHNHCLPSINWINEEGDDDFFKALNETGFRSVHGNSFCTYCRKNPFTKFFYEAKLDYIFYRPDQLKLMDSGKINDSKVVSDHIGIWARFASRRYGVTFLEALLPKK